MIQEQIDIHLTAERLGFLQSQLQLFTNRYFVEVRNPVSGLLKSNAAPRSLAEFEAELQRLRDAISESIDIAQSNPGASRPLPGARASVVKLVILEMRRSAAADVDFRKKKTTTPEMIAALEQELEPFDKFLREEWFSNQETHALPRLADYLTLEQVDVNLKNRGFQLQERAYDEKFHLLQAPALLLGDISYFREMSAIRDNKIAVAFLDIDDFKAFNTTYGHIAVDAQVLPVFMRELERFAFGRGFAYRISGDEYAVLLSNAEGCSNFFKNLQHKLAGLPYFKITHRTCVSIGLCVVTTNCFLSDQSIVERANRAMRHAKDKGKHCIATYQGALYRDDDLVIDSDAELAGY
jgi:diguanylate cyclase (GGDEF)-like protein